MGIFTFADLIEYYPFRHEDRTQFHKISEISEDMFAAQIIGRIVSVELVGGTGKQRLVATFRDSTSHMELVWFQSISYFQKFLKPNAEYVIYGKPVWFGGNYSITHPEIDLLTANNNKKGYFNPYIL